MKLSKKNTKVFVTSVSFSKNEILKKKLLSKYPNTSFNKLGRRLTSEELIYYARNCEKLIIALDKIDEKILSKLPNLKVISKYGVGIDNVQLNSLRKFNIKLGWTRGVNKEAVAELTMGLILMLNRRILQNKITLSSFKNHQLEIARELSNCTVGIIGVGSIGSEILKKLKNFKCKIYLNDIRKLKYKDNEIKITNLKNLLSKSDIITIHTPLSKNTENLINANNMKLLKKDVILINCARGGIVNENDLYKFLKNNKHSYAAFDVFKIEPPINNPLLKLKNFFSTSHIGGSTYESINLMGEAAIKGLDQFTSIDTLKKFGY